MRISSPCGLPAAACRARFALSWISSSKRSLIRPAPDDRLSGRLLTKKIRARILTTLRVCMACGRRILARRTRDNSRQGDKYEINFGGHGGGLDEYFADSV